MTDTSISWTDKTWNVTRGCRRVSPGCENCYAERQANRFAGPGGAYEGLIKRTASGPPHTVTARWNGETRFAVDHLADPLRWRKPCRIFVDSMSDLFYEGFTNEQIAAVFGVMAACPQHTFQVLTKRARRMREWFEWVASAPVPFDGLPVYPDYVRQRQVCCRHAWMLPDSEARVARREPYGLHPSDDVLEFQRGQWPPPNVWLGVSVEDQERADERIPELLRTPAAVRFLSCEPLLSTVDLWAHLWEPADRDGTCQPHNRFRVRPDAIDWVIVGCESGPGARPCDVAWLRSLRDQCAAAGVAFFLKQARGPERNGIGGSRHMVPIARVRDGSFGAVTADDGSRAKGGGVIELPYLDGVQHAAFPKVR